MVGIGMGEIELTDSAELGGAWREGQGENLGCGQEEWGGVRGLAVWAFWEEHEGLVEGDDGLLHRFAIGRLQWGGFGCGK